MLKGITYFIERSVLLAPVWPTLLFIENNKYQPDFNVFKILSLSFVFVACLIVLETVARIVTNSNSNYARLAAVGLVTCYLQFYFDLSHLIRDTLAFIPNQSISNDILLYGFIFSLIPVYFGSVKLLNNNNTPKILGVMLLIQLSFPVYSLLMDDGQIKFHQTSITQSENTPAPMYETNKQFPNAYLFVFDAYLRSDFLETQYGFKNTAFNEALLQSGFVVVDNSRSNFPSTQYALNYAYNPSASTLSKSELTEFLMSNDSFKGGDISEIQRWFQNDGYVFFKQSYTGNHQSGCNPNCITKEPFLTYTELNFIKNTPLFDLWVRLDQTVTFKWLNAVPQDNLYPLTKIEPDGDRPIFLISHVLLPHPPYSLDRSCNYLTDEIMDRFGGIVGYEASSEWSAEKVRIKYLEQLRCANLQMRKIIGWVEQNDPDALVAFISDHGWKDNYAVNLPSDVEEKRKVATQMRYANFMAARVPERCRSKFSKNMTLINFLLVIHGCATFKEHPLFSDQLYEIVSEDSGPKIVEMSDW